MEIDKKIRNKLLISDSDDDINRGQRSERQAWVVPPSAAQGMPFWSSDVKDKELAVLSFLVKTLYGATSPSPLPIT